MTINKLDTTGFWAVNGTAIYVPSTPCPIERTNVTSPSTGRDEAGYMHIGWLRRNVRKFKLHYNAITGTELNYMENLMQGKEFTFTGLQDSNVVTFSAYAGESSYELMTYAIGSGPMATHEPIYLNYEIHVIEM